MWDVFDKNGKGLIRVKVCKSIKIDVYVIFLNIIFKKIVYIFVFDY